MRVLLIKLGIRYGKKLELCDLYPQYKNILHVPTPIVKKIAEELHRELVAADMLGELAKNAYTLGEKLSHYKTVIDKLHEQTSAKELAKPILWENAKRLISSSIAEGKGALAPLTERQSLFLEFKKAYPKQQNMGRAEKWFKTHKPSRLTVEKMLFAIENQKNTLAWEIENGQFIPDPGTWLNNKAWENEVTCSESNNASGIFSDAYGKIPIYKKNEVVVNE